MTGHLALIKLYLWRAFDALAVRTVRRASHDTGPVALIRLDLIGDFVLWLDAAAEYRRAWANHRLILIGHPAWAELARGLPYWDEVITIDPLRFANRIGYRWRMLRRLRALGCSIVVQTMYSRLLPADAMALATGAPRRIAFAGETGNIRAGQKRISDRWYTRLVAATPGAMELKRNAELVRAVCNPAFRASLPVLPVLPSAEERTSPIPGPSTPDGDYLVVAPGASLTLKRWPAERFAQMMAAAERDSGTRPVLTGSAAEHDLCEAIARAYRELAPGRPARNLAGTTTLPELVELIRGARLVIGNDSAAIHIAAAVGTPSICILGGGHHGRFLPYQVETGGLSKAPRALDQRMPCYGCGWKCTQPHEPGGPAPCIAEVSFDAAFAAWRALRSQTVSHA